MIAFIPVGHEQATILRRSGATAENLAGYAPTAQMMNIHGYQAEQEEDAAYAAQTYARVAALAEAVTTLTTPLASGDWWLLR